jgi:hypothetical protein
MPALVTHSEIVHTEFRVTYTLNNTSKHTSFDTYQCALDYVEYIPVAYEVALFYIERTVHTAYLYGKLTHSNITCYRKQLA